MNSLGAHLEYDEEFLQVRVLPFSPSYNPQHEEPMLTLTLTPNRNPGPPIATRMILYWRDGNRVDAFLATKKNGDVCVERRPWHMIHESEVDPEFERAWRQHVASQRSLARDDQRA